MSIEELTDYIISEYESAVLPNQNRDDGKSRDVGEPDATGLFWKEITSLFSGQMLREPVSRKNAARILYAFYRDVLRKPDIEWGEAKSLKDIYECRVCANPIAQMYTNGILNAKSPQEFGLGDILDDEELTLSVQSLLQF